MTLARLSRASPAVKIGGFLHSGVSRGYSGVTRIRGRRTAIRDEQHSAMGGPGAKRRSLADIAYFAAAAPHGGWKHRRAWRSPERSAANGW